MRTFYTTQQSDRDSYLSQPAKSAAPPYTPSRAQLAPYPDDTTLNISDALGLAKAGTLDIETPGTAATTTIKMFAPNRRLDSGATIEGGVQVVGLTEGNLARHNFQSSNVHPFVHNFTSPIGAYTHLFPIGICDVP